MCSFNIVYSNTVNLSHQIAHFMLFFAQLFNDISQRFFDGYEQAVFDDP